MKYLVKISGTSLALSASIIFLMLACLGSCTYSLDEKYFKPIHAGTAAANFSLTLTDKNDTIYLFQPTTISYNVTDSVAVVSETDIYLGSSLLSRSSSSSGTFAIDGVNFKTGTFILKIVATDNGNDGSLAAVISGNLQTRTKTWVVIIDADPPPAPVVTASIENGFLKLTWPPFTKKSFVKYVVYASNCCTGKSVTITDPNRTSYVDSTLVADPLNYQVTTYTHTTEASSASLPIQDPITSSFTFNSADSSVTYSWSKPRYWGALKDVVLSAKNTVLQTITSLTDTVVTIKLTDLVFGENPFVELDMYAKYGGTGYSNWTTISNPFNAKVWPFQGQYIWYSKQFNGFATSTASSLSVYDRNSLQLSQTFATSGGLLSFPYPGNLAYYAQDTRVFQQNLTTGQIQSALLPLYYGNAQSISAAATGQFEFIYYYNPPPYTSTGLADVTTGTITTYGGPNYVLADDGRYAQVGNTIYSISGSTFTLIGTVSGASAVFRPDNTDEIIVQSIPTQIRKTSDLSLLRVITPPADATHYGGYDVATNSIMYGNSSQTRVYVINIDTNQLTSVSVSGFANFYGGYLVLGALYVKIL